MTRRPPLLFSSIFAVLLAAASAEDPACPRFIRCNIGEQGLGDQLEHYVYCAYVSTLLDAEPVISPDCFTKSSHRNFEEYRTVAELLGINLALTEDAARARYPNASWGKDLRMDRPDALKRAEEARAGGAPLPCFTFIDSHIYSCGATGDPWCDNVPGFRNFELTYWRLRNNSIRERCFAMGEGFLDRGTHGDQVHISWHLRNGDICLHCDPGYPAKVYEQLLSVPAIRRAHHLAIDAHDYSEGIDKEPLFRRAAARFDFFNTNQTLVSTVCRFATADVLVTAGSSLAPFIAAFLPPLNPIVVEERRKEANTDPRPDKHFFKDYEAVLMDGDGQIITEGYAAWLDSVLSDRLRMERQFNSSSSSIGGGGGGGAGCSGGNASASPG